MKEEHIDIYCERTGPEYWSEPINALTNLAFIVSAIWIAKLLHTNGRGARPDPALWILCGLIFAIGIGSWLFHTHATRWAMFADVIPIVIFILTYTWYALRRFAQFDAVICAAGVLAVSAVAIAIPPLTGFRGGAYIAALMAMIIIGAYLSIAKGHRGGGALLAAAGIFAVSLTLRTADLRLCGNFPLGTHFVWHLLNSVVLLFVARAMVLYGRRI